MVKSTSTKSSKQSGGSAGGFAQPTDNPLTRMMGDVTGTCYCTPSFRNVDGHSIDRIIDIPASFSPMGVFPQLCKTVTLGMGLFTLYWGLGRDLRVFWLAYLTHWALTFAILYLLASFMNSFVSVSQPPPLQTRVGMRVKLTWILFTIACNLQIVVTVAYWFVIYDGSSMSSYSVLSHGVVAVMVLIDGLIINTIPVRLRHWIEFVFPIGLLYLIWSFVHYKLSIGNPDYQDEDPETNDDLIYGVLDWGEEPQPTQALIVSAMILFVLSPLSQFVMWFISNFRRRYVKDPPSSSSSDYVEMGNTSSSARKASKSTSTRGGGRGGGSAFV